ncbi:hypothetical protein [Segetibacter aerophilus]|uniref:DUF4440 domain-containing protein n=1 Tax=Segetibacter aerophilus TaxID=670293 RepID=A0A512BGM4_9BACT|nr:hypothetical protein [Segetibacter aerophilus]GEO11121.1 hypothetical protein SAE01_36170 [Segetibacter aerophilus]
MHFFKIAIISFVYHVTFINASSAQKATSPATNLKRQAEQMVNFFSTGDLDKFSKFTYPKVIQMIGGETKMISVLKKEMDSWESQGIRIDSVSVGDVSKIVKAGNELHSLITQRLVMKVPGGRMVKNSFLLAISPNNGANWYFLDTAPLTPDILKKLFPNFNKEIVIPTKEEPVMIPNE